MDLCEGNKKQAAWHMPAVMKAQARPGAAVQVLAQNLTFFLTFSLMKK